MSLHSSRDLALPHGGKCVALAFLCLTEGLDRSVRRQDRSVSNSFPLVLGSAVDPSTNIFETQLCLLAPLGSDALRALPVDSVVSFCIVRQVLGSSCRRLLSTVAARVTESSVTNSFSLVAGSLVDLDHALSSLPFCFTYGLWTACAGLSRNCFSLPKKTGCGCGELSFAVQRGRESNHGPA